MKILVLGIQLAVVGLLVFSFYPVVEGGLDLDSEEDLSAKIDDTTGEFALSGAVRVTSKMPWDIEMSYRIIIGTEDNVVAQTDFVSVTVPTNDSAVLRIDLRASMFNVVLYMLDNGMNENGKLGDMNLPVLLHLSGSYINRIVSMDLDMQIDSLAELESGNVTLSADGKKLTANDIKFTPPEFLSGLSGGFSFSVPGITGNLNLNDGHGHSTLDFEMTGTEDILETLTNALNSDGTLTMKVDGHDVTLSADDAEIFIDLFTSIHDKLSGGA